MKCSNSWSLTSSSVAAACLAVATVTAQSPRTPGVRLLSAPRLTLPGDVDSSNPAVWSMVEGLEQLFVISSWGGVPVRASGPSIEHLEEDAPVAFVSHPGHGVWMEAIVPDDSGTWYGYYHHERPADQCGRSDRQLPRIGAMRSADEGRTWEDLGIVIDAPPGSEACDSANRYVLGGVGDVTAALDRDHQDLYLYFSQYVRDGASQGVAAARLAWADRDRPSGKVTIWNHGAWLPVIESSSPEQPWIYPAGSPLVAATRPFHDRSSATDVFWGPSIHWNTYLDRYVMLLNRAKDDEFGQDGIYIAFTTTLSDPASWTVPAKILNGGSWYPQVIGTEGGSGTDKLAGKRARFFMTGRSDRFIEFER